MNKMSSKKSVKSVTAPEQGCEQKRAGRPRCPVAHHNILCAAQELLEESGYADLTIEGVAARAGVAKTTVYRRWPSKADLVMEAFLMAIMPSSPPDTGSLREDLRRQVRLLIKVLNGPLGRTVAALVGGGQMDEGLTAEFRRQYQAVRSAEIEEVVKRGIARGEIRADVNVEVLIDALYGPLYYRLLLRHAPLTARYAEELVELVLSGLDG
jgi:AcrR family transcriptional regulator